MLPSSLSSSSMSADSPRLPSSPRLVAWLAPAWRESIATLRQWRYAGPVRIARLDAGGAVEVELRAVAAEITRVADAIQALRAAPPAPPPPDDPAKNRALMRSYSDLGTTWWRIWKKMLRPGTQRPTDEMRGVFSFVETLRDTLQDAGVKVIDHTGKDFFSGQSLEVLEFQDKPGIEKERVSETLRPTIYFKEHLIQMGKVIVDTPVKGGVQPA